jgi:hypothetical protein
MHGIHGIKICNILYKCPRACACAFTLEHFIPNTAGLESNVPYKGDNFKYGQQFYKCINIRHYRSKRHSYLLLNFEEYYADNLRFTDQHILKIADRLIMQGSYM